MRQLARRWGGFPKGKLGNVPSGSPRTPLAPCLGSPRTLCQAAGQEGAQPAGISSSSGRESPLKDNVLSVQPVRAVAMATVALVTMNLFPRP